MFNKTVLFIKKHFEVLIILADALSLVAAAFAAQILKFDGSSTPPLWYTQNAKWVILVDFVLTVSLFLAFKFQKRMWQYFSTKDYIDFAGVFVGSRIVTFAAFFFIWIKHKRAFITWYLLFSLLFFVFLMFVRAVVFVGYRIWCLRFRDAGVNQSEHKKRIMIIGAGAAGSRLISEIKSSAHFAARYEIVVLIDDSKRKFKEILGGVEVYGGRDKIEEAAKKFKVDEIYFAIPSMDEISRKEILDICSKTGCSLKTLPMIDSFTLNTSVNAQLRKVEYTDLLGREQIKPDLTKAFEQLEGKTVLVTGGGGSIGSELVRQIAKSGVAKRVIIFDIAENGAYDIQQEVRRKCPGVDLKVLIGSVRDEQRLCEIFEEYHPDIIYHAAAHKHVPLMEDSPKEAVKNNCFGTYNLAKTADKYGVKRFVMISTDKAVNPTNVMGATKRICEMIVQSFNKISKTDFVAVRFGNVLGSNGSVIPLFKEQIEAGGPVTVTHPDIIRYFMLIPEAVSLVLQAGANAKGGEIFILDMGSPVKIRELAENLIRLSGHIPGEDIEIKYTGLREGEKLYEELLIAEEGIQKTENDLIYVAKPVDIDSDALFAKLQYIRENLDELTRTQIITLVSEIVTTYHPNNSEYKEKAEVVS